MRSFLTLVSLVFSLTFCQASIRNIIPFPKELKESNGLFNVQENFPVGVNSPPSQRITHAIKRLQNGLAYRTKKSFYNSPTIEKNLASGLNISFNKAVNLGLNVDESYHLVIKNGSIDLSAETDIGILRGIETLLQLVEHRDSSHVIPCVEISDAPRFQWRGLLLDVSRHFMPIDVVKRNIDAMAAVKLNILHLHLSDDQAWRLESKLYPALHEKASNGEYYTQNQIKDLVSYAQLRGITIIPEIDIPGHTTAILSALPELASKKENVQVEKYFGVMYPALDPTNEDTYTFLSKALREVDDLFPGPYIHIGGDEVKPDQWNENARIKAFMTENKFNPQGLQNYFLQRVADSLKQSNAKIIGWDEVFVDGLPKESIVHCWRNKEVCYQAARNGYKTIVSHGFYLDLLYPASNHYMNEIVEEGAGLSPEQQKNILGGEACMWSELVDARTVDSRLWPRLGAVAENLWSQKSAIRKKDLLPRLAVLSNSLNEFKLLHQSAGYAILHELAKNHDIIPLIELKNVCEPVTGYQRHGAFAYTTSTPLNSFADAVNVDAPIVDPFARAVDEFVVSGKNKENFDYIAEKIYSWAGYYEFYERYFAANPELQKLAPLAQKLSTLAKLADEAMEMAVKGRVPKQAWIDAAKLTLTECKEPVKNVKLAIVDDVERLLNFSKDHDVIEF